MTQHPLKVEDIPTLQVTRVDKQNLSKNSETRLNSSKLSSQNAAGQTMRTNPTIPTSLPPLPPPESQIDRQKVSTSGLDGSSNDKVSKANVPIEEPEIPGELTPAQKRLAMQLATTYASMGMLVSAFNRYDGIVLISQSEQRAMEMVAACRHNKAVYKWIERLAYGNDVIAAIAGHGIMTYAILANHERIQANPVILARFGLTKEQVLNSIPGLTDNAEPAKHP